MKKNTSEKDNNEKGQIWKIQIPTMTMLKRGNMNRRNVNNYISGKNKLVHKTLTRNTLNNDDYEQAHFETKITLYRKNLKKDNSEKERSEGIL